VLPSPSGIFPSQSGAFLLQRTTAGAPRFLIKPVGSDKQPGHRVPVAVCPAELRALNTDLARQISATEKRDIAEARRRIEQIALEAGMTLDALLAKPSRSRAPTPLYVNPDDATQTWTGRGRQPAWVKAWLDCGITLEELARQDVPATHQEAAAN
jgi:DNA-binding protein H-NS